MPSIRKKLAGKKTKLSAPSKRLEDHPANLNGFQEGDFHQVPLDQINPDPKQPRKYFNPESLKELSESVKQKGVLQPVIIRRDDQGKIYLVAGERRFRAAKKAGLEKIPAIITGGNSMEISLIENLQRENLRPVEEAEALAQMIEGYNYTQEKLALAIGKARTTITEILTLNKLPEEVKEECRHADIFSRRILIEVAKQKTPKAMISLFSKIKQYGLKSEQARDLVRKPTQGGARPQDEMALGKISDLLNCLKKIDWNAVKEPQAALLADGLKALKSLIDEISAEGRIRL